MAQWATNTVVMRTDVSVEEVWDKKDENKQHSKKVHLKCQVSERGGSKHTGADPELFLWLMICLKHCMRCEEEEKKGGVGGGEWCGHVYLLIRCSAWSPDPARWPLHGCGAWKLSVCVHYTHNPACFKKERQNHHQRARDCWTCKRAV